MPRALALTVLLLAGAARAEADPWWGPDKALHLGVAAGLSLSAGWVLHGLGVPAPLDAALGAGLTVLLGAAKEAADALGLGTPSWRDLTWDVVGAVTGALLALAVDALLTWLGPPPRPLLALSRGY
jgi:putative lipoprotein